MDVDKKVNILLVDDQPQKLVSYEAALSRLGENLIKAGSGTEALQILLKEEIAVILLDVNMPVMDGFETAAMIRKHPRFQNIPIIYVTGVNTTDMDRLKGYELGAVDYVYVPVIQEILRAKVAVFTELYRKTRELAALNLALEQRVAERTAVLEVMQQELRTRVEQLAEADRRKDEFLAMLAHELRNPLAAIVNAVHFMRLLGVKEPGLERAKDVMERQGQHMSRMLDDLLDVSRITRGKLELRKEPLDLAAVLADAVEATRPLIESRQHQLSVSLPPEPLPLEADRTRLEQVFGNLLNNAAKYTDPGGRIWLTAVREGDETVIRVHDTGLGIAPDMQSRIFDMFVQVKSSLKRTSSGLGLGLTLVKRLVEMHGGSVVASSAGPGQGSEFMVRLPLAASPLAAPETLDPPVRCTGRRILIVEDNADAREMLRDLLSLLGHHVEVAEDGPQGVEVILQQHPDVALIDIGLPGMDGYELARKVRDAPDGGTLRLIALTGYGQPEDQHRALAAGFDAHLVKPVKLHELSRLLAETGK